LLQAALLPRETKINNNHNFRLIREQLQTAA